MRSIETKTRAVLRFETVYYDHMPTLRIVGHSFYENAYRKTLNYRSRLLVRDRSKVDRKNAAKSGISEDLSELDRLLDHIISDMD